MHIRLRSYHIALWIIMTTVTTVTAQRKIRLEPGAGQLVGFKKNGISYTSVKDNVQFTHRGTRFFCDSAVIAKKSNYLEAYGHVRILDGDSITIVADKLFYDGNTKIAKLRSGVVLTQLGRMELFTDYLDYDRNTNIAFYFNNGKIVDTTNVLTSKKGYYNTTTNTASFKTNVVGKNKDYTMVSDTLVYNTKTGVVYFVAPTVLTDVDGNVFHHDGGQYNSKQKRSAYISGIVETEDYFLKSADLKLDDIRGLYYATGDVLMVAKKDDIYITGQQSVYNKKTATTKIFDNPLMRMVSDGDTLYLKADTLISIDSKKNEEKRLLAYNNVRIYKTDLQGVADSLAYSVADSVMYFYGNPVLWTDDNQLTADSIQMLIRNKTIDALYLKNKAFVITQDSAKNYNQIKGREMVATFKDNELSKVDVFGNGESIFFMYDQETGAFTGMNRIICSNITLVFEEKTLKEASFLINPEGKFIPPHELKDPDKRLKDFSWHGDLRPALDDFDRPPIVMEAIDLEIKGTPIDPELKKPVPVAPLKKTPPQPRANKRLLKKIKQQ